MPLYFVVQIDSHELGGPNFSHNIVANLNIAKATADNKIGLFSKGEQPLYLMIHLRRHLHCCSKDHGWIILHPVSHLITHQHPFWVIAIGCTESVVSIADGCNSCLRNLSQKFLKNTPERLTHICKSVHHAILILAQTHPWITKPTQRGLESLVILCDMTAIHLFQLCILTPTNHLSVSK